MLMSVKPRLCHNQLPEAWLEWHSVGGLTWIREQFIDVIMTTMASQITSLMIVYSIVYSDVENIKAPRHWPLCGEFTGTGEFPAQMFSYAENVSGWWRHHEIVAEERWIMPNVPN